MSSDRSRRNVSLRSTDKGGVGPRYITTALVIVIGIAIFLYLVRSILIPFVFAGIVAYVCTPLVDRMEQRTGWPRWLFAVWVLLLLLGAAILVGYYGIPSLMHDALHVGSDLQGAMETLARRLIGRGSVTLLGEQINAARIGAYTVDGLRVWFNTNGHVFTAAALGFAGAFGFILGWVLLGYLLIGGPRIAGGLFWLVPPQQRPFVHRVWRDLDPVLRRYFIGVALVVVYASILAYVGLGLILNLHHAVFLGLISGVFEVVPIAGPFASAVIAGLVAVREAQSSLNILAYVAYAIALRISIDQFFGPIVLGRAAYVQPVLVIFCFLAGAVLFNVIGVVMAVPVALTIKATLAELYRDPDAMRE